MSSRILLLSTFVHSRGCQHTREYISIVIYHASWNVVVLELARLHLLNILS